MQIGAYEFIWNPPAAGQVDWVRRWETAVTATGRGNEEREAKRAVGLKAISYAAQPVTLEERIALVASLDAALKSGKACAPYWGRSSVLAADCTGTTVTLEVGSGGGLVWDWAALDYIFLFDWNARAWEVRLVSGVAGNVLTLSGGAVARTYAKGTLVWPLLFGKLECDSADIITNHRLEPKITITENENGLSKVESNCPALTTYLGRPVAPLDANPSGPNTFIDISRTQNFSYDLRELLIGFGAASYGPLANNIVNGWELTAILDGDEAIKAFDCLTAGLPGRGTGFWLTDVSCIFDIISSPAANKVRVTNAGLAASWVNDPAIYVTFKKPGSADKFAGITGIANVGGGLEEVTFDAGVSVDETWLAYRLRYVRLASDEEKAKFIVENRMARQIRVVELPEEYAAVETGRAPVWFYTFWIETPGGNTYWRYTSYAENLTSNGNVFTAANLTHGSIKRAAEASAEECTIDGVREVGNVFALFAPLTLPLYLWVQIEEATIDDPDTTEVLFIGIAQNSPMQGRQASIKFSSFMDALGAEVLNFIFQPRCNYRLFGAGCTLARADYALNFLICGISADRRQLDVKIAAGGPFSGNNINGYDMTTANYFAQGWIEVGAGATFQIATILSNVTQPVDVGGGLHLQGVTLKLNQPLQPAAAIGDAIALIPGCDGTLDTCTHKFSNSVNFGGHPFIPNKNPGLPPLSSPTSSKK